MDYKRIQRYLQDVLANMPSDWLSLTTHRLDIYNESLAKVEFLEQFDALYEANDASSESLSEIPTAYDYIRLGHPLSCVFEWAMAKAKGVPSEHVISFSSKITPILAILRKNLLDNTKSRVAYIGKLPEMFDAEVVKRVYGYNFDLVQVGSVDEIEQFDGCTILMAAGAQLDPNNSYDAIDFFIYSKANLGSVLVANSKNSPDYISAIQHVRRRETIAMTPINCLLSLKMFVEPGLMSSSNTADNREKNKASVLESISRVTDTTTDAAVGSSGLSVQYAIMMGLIDDANQNYPGKAIKFVVPPNCYGGTNDQARRVAACLDNVEVVDLPVDGGNDMVQGINTVLDKIATEDAVPYIIAEIPTNPRVEVPDLQKLKEALSQQRLTADGEIAVDPVFILDQTFCPNVHFLGVGAILSSVRAISYASGSKFPSGGKCTAGYCVANKKSAALMDKIQLHLDLCDNEATDLQYELLAQQLPSMVQRIADAYTNTRAFVTFIQNALPDAKINFVSEELAAQGFTPSVFSLDLPTKGNTDEERETYKRALNHKLIKMMITEIPNESKYCVSYGQLKGCYWTIPATSTQGTTKEGDKDYIARVALSAKMDMDLHKKVFMDFVNGI